MKKKIDDARIHVTLNFYLKWVNSETIFQSSDIPPTSVFPFSFNLYLAYKITSHKLFNISSRKDLRLVHINYAAYKLSCDIRLATCL